MKKEIERKKYYRLLAVGLLIMNIGTVSNLILKTNLNIDIIDFMKGIGIVFVLFSAYKILISNRKTTYG